MFKIILPGVMLLLISATMSKPVFKPKEADLSFKEHVSPIFENRCTRCHNADSVLPDVTDYDTAYELKGKIKHKLETKKMPYFGKMTESERDTVLEWIRQGAKE